MASKIQIKPCENVSEFSKDMTAWLQTKASELKSSNIFLLSFHDDGVVWGKIKDGKLLTSESLNDDRFPKFRSETLQELRLFGENGQLQIWRTSEIEFNASLALESEFVTETDEVKSEKCTYEFLQDENQVLWGTDYDDDNGDFMIVRDGSEGLKHAFPQVAQTKFDGKKRPLRLHVKHYIEYDNDGCARIAFSRLANVSVE